MLMSHQRPGNLEMVGHAWEHGASLQQALLEIVDSARPISPDQVNRCSGLSNRRSRDCTVFSFQCASHQLPPLLEDAREAQLLLRSPEPGSPIEQWTQGLDSLQTGGEAGFEQSQCRLLC